ncbi:MAG: elongation factor-1 alpha [Gammaproteobacteria bacterium]
MKQPHKTTWLNLPSLGLSIRMLFTGYLLTIGFGLLMAGVQILLTHGMADGKLGLSIDDIVYSYYGNRNNSKLESKLNGSMKDKAPEEIRAKLIHWARDGAPEDQWHDFVSDDVQMYCAGCNANIPGLANISEYDVIKEAAATDRGASIDSLTRVSHIHLFGIAFIFFIMGFIFSFAVGVPKWLKELVILLPFVFLILDIISWWATKWVPAFAWFTMIGGIGYTLASTFMWFTSMYQMWVMPYNGKDYCVNTWED